MIPKLPSFRTIGLVLGGLVMLGLCLAALLAKAEARHWEKRFGAEHHARQLDHAEWQRAYYQATYNHVLNVERTRLARAAVDERTIHALTADRDRASADFDRLRDQAEAYLRSASSPDMSAQRDSTCRAVAGTSCEEIPALLKAAQDNTDQLLRWIEWGKAQAKIPSVAPLTKPAAESAQRGSVP